MHLFFGASSRLTPGAGMTKLNLRPMTALNHLRAHRHHHHNGHMPRPLSCT
jgi:hypothetical protein